MGFAEDLIEFNMDMTALADTIREKTGGTDKSTLDGMVDASTNIKYILSSKYISGDLTDVRVSEIDVVGDRAFYSYATLKNVDLPSATSIGAYAFHGCSSLQRLILRSETICTLSSTTAFTKSSFASNVGFIYVPSALVNTYKAATNWSTYSARFRAIEDYTIDGTIAGEFE